MWIAGLEEKLLLGIFPGALALGIVAQAGFAPVPEVRPLDTNAAIFTVTVTKSKLPEACRGQVILQRDQAACERALSTPARESTRLSAPETSVAVVAPKTRAN